MTQVSPTRDHLTDTPIWKELTRHYAEMERIHMRVLFNQDPARGEKFSLQFNDMLFDYSKNIISEKTCQLLFQLAREARLEEWVERMFSGEKINHTEDRAVLHVALRARQTDSLHFDNEDIIVNVHTELDRVRKISEDIRNRRWAGANGQAITDVVNIGIGGSDLGPKMVAEGLRPYVMQDLTLHFVSNLDENHILDTLQQLTPSTTLLIISSKSFTTQETRVNAETAREWFLNSIQDQAALKRHFLAITANPEAAVAFGIDPANVLRIWDWVGGRYSLWSAIGLSIAIAMGMDHFEAMLKGAYDMDQHFRHQPLEQNIPVIMALLGIWYNNFFGAQSHAILPYDEHLNYFPAYLQQADMESNGKTIDREGLEVDYSTGPIIFGEIGIKGQHAFYQLLHQGAKLVPADFLAPITDFNPIPRHHRALMANVFAQTEALMKGRTREEAEKDLKQHGFTSRQIQALLPYKVFPGNKPTNTLLFKTLDPKTLGSLIALYEHKIFVQGVIWNINSYDQWGVELGKQLAATILAELDDDSPVTTHDASTNNLVNYYKRMRAEHES